MGSNPGSGRKSTTAPRALHSRLPTALVKCREHISLLIILCIIVYVTNKAHPSLICICCIVSVDLEKKKPNPFPAPLYFGLMFIMFWAQLHRYDLFEYGLIFHPHLPFVSLVIVHMEGSGKWPSEPMAIRHVKAAFHICLRELLCKQHNYRCHATPGYLDVWKVTCI